MNTFGNHIRLTTFGESHGSAIGGVLDGFPARFIIDEQALQYDLTRRATGEEWASAVATSSRARQEQDHIEWLSGILNGQTLGTPIAFLIRNTDAHSADYEALQHVFRPAHADYTYQAKYSIRDVRGGGRASARETVARVVAGSLAKQWLRSQGIQIQAEVVQVGEATTIPAMQTLLQEVRAAGDSIGGIVRCQITGVPAGIGEPLYNKLSARLAYAMLSINACKGFDFGSGFADIAQRGSTLNDTMHYSEADGVTFASNHAGGILGGISTGQDIYFRCAFKPTPSISISQHTINEQHENITLRVNGRHDTCVALRAPVIVEAMAALTLMDFLLPV